MDDNDELIKKLTKAKDYFAKENGHIIYRDPETGKLKLDYSKLRKDDNRNFVPYVEAALRGSSLLSKAEDISGYGYEVYIKGGANIHKADIEYARRRLGNKAMIFDNLGNSNRDRTEITIRFKKSWI